MNEFVAQKSFNDPDKGLFVAPPGLMRFATWEADGRVARRRRLATPACTHSPRGTTVLDLVRAGLPAALEAGAAALDGPAVPLDSVRLLPPLQAPTVRDFVAFEEHVEGVRKSVDGGAGVVPEWYQAPTFYFTNPYALVGAHDDVAGAARARSGSTSSSRSPSSSAGTAPR